MDREKMIKIEDILRIAQKRRWAFLVPTIAVFLLSVVVIIAWTPVYRSTSTILIEEQEIPRDYVMATVTTYAEQRLQAINQRIMSAERLLEIIRNFNLYEDKRARLTTEEIIETMRKDDIKFDTVMANIFDRRTGQKAEATIAFTVSYEGKNPAVVQKVANVLASLYLQENLKVVGEQAESTTRFLEEEMKSVQGRLTELEGEIAEYKEMYPHALPELLQFNLQSLDWTERNYDQLKEQLRAYKEKESSLQAQLATVAPDAVNQDKERLKELRVSLGSFKARYSDEYPDIKKLKKEIADVEKRLETQQEQPAPLAKKPDNPAYVALSAELASVQADIKAVKQQIDKLDKRKSDYRGRLEMYPRVEEGYKNLVVERNNTQAKYDDLMRKFMEAKVAHGLEKEKMGERFTLIDPARLPEKPVRPNRPLILLIGLLLGLAGGVGTVYLEETSDRSARGAKDLLKAFHVDVLAEIPEIVRIEDRLTTSKRLKRVFALIVVVLIIMLAGIHFFVMDLYVLWARACRYLAL